MPQVPQSPQLVPPDKSKCWTCKHGARITVQRVVQGPMQSPLALPAGPQQVLVGQTDIAACVLFSFVHGDVVADCEGFEEGRMEDPDAA